MAKSKIQKILAKSRSRDPKYSVLEFVPVVFTTKDDMLRIYSPCSGEFNNVSEELSTAKDFVTYTGKDVTTVQGREDVKESVADTANGLDIRVFVVSESKRKNDKSCVYEYDVYTQFQKFLKDVSRYSKLNESDKRVVYKPSVKVINNYK